MTRLDLIEQFENETELPATFNNGGIGGYTKEYTEWLEQCLVKNLTIPVVSVALPDHCTFWNKRCDNQICDNGGICVYDNRQ